MLMLHCLLYPIIYSQLSTSQPTSQPVKTSAKILSIEEFSYTGADQNVTVPPHALYMYVYLWGAGGGIATSTIMGGTGAYVEGIMSVTPGTILTVIVGEGGKYNGAATYGGGGPGGVSGSGGGRSAIRNGVTELVTAGGGGGSNTRGFRGGAATSCRNGVIEPISYQGSVTAPGTSSQISTMS